MKTVIITGSSKGIGRAIAEKMAGNSYNVVINCRKKEDAEKVAKEISEKFGVDTLGIEADVRNSSHVRTMIQRSVEKFKTIDALVNNAGVVLVKPLEETTEEEFDNVIETNLKGAFLCCKEILPYMISKGSGTIVNISSGAGKYGFAQLSSYCASKFGLNGLSESLSNETKQFGITTVSICPGAVATDMQKQFMSEEQFESKKKDMIQPGEVADVVVNAIEGKYKSGSLVDL